MKHYTNYSLLHNNTFGMDVLAEEFVEYNSIDELQEVVENLKGGRRRWFSIGGGSNLLFCQDFEGTILHSCIKGIKIEEENEKEVLVRVGAGEVWDSFVQYAVEREWYGCENLSFIPGEVGGIAVQNIGAYGSEAKDTIEWVEVIEVSTNKILRISNRDCEYDYRYSRFKEDWKEEYRLLQELKPYAQKFGKMDFWLRVDNVVRKARNV